MSGAWEFPITFCRDFRNRNRPLQLTACSSGEIEHALLQAWERGWYCVVIVSHSFELIRRRKNANGKAKVDRIAVRRFERLCRFLSEHTDKFRTCTFSEPLEIDIAVADSKPLRARAVDTSTRLWEQLTRRIMG
jgi:hypothetical protein